MYWFEANGRSIHISVVVSFVSFLRAINDVDVMIRTVLFCQFSLQGQTAYVILCVIDVILLTTFI